MKNKFDHRCIQINTDKINGRLGRGLHSAFIIPYSSLLFLAADERR